MVIKTKSRANKCVFIRMENSKETKGICKREFVRSKMKHNENTPSGNPFLHKICSGYIGTTLCFLGIMGNILSVLVWKRINRKRSGSSKSAGIYLVTLAIVDSGLLVFFISIESIPQLASSIMKNSSYVIFYCYIGFPLYFFFIIASIWMVICITYNRFVAVIFPHHTYKLNSMKVTYILIGVTLLFSFIINVPHFFNFRPNQNSSGIEPTTYGLTRESELYDFWLHCMVLVLVPWLTIMILNTTIIYNLLTKKKLQVSVKGERKKERQTTIMLMTVTIAFLIFLLWQCLTQCFWMLGFGKSNKKTWFHIDSAYGFARLGVVVNSSMNFLLYCVSGSMFRKELAKLLCCGKMYVRFTDSSTTSSSSRFSNRTDSKVDVEDSSVPVNTVANDQSLLNIKVPMDE